MFKRRFFQSGFFSISTLAIALGLAAGSLVFAGASPDEEFDTLDGTGKSGKTVNVIEWENNLEVHVYPKGSIAGLGFKLDQPSKDKKVMVISYRFTNNPKQTLVRRAILGIPMRDGFKVYKDPNTDDYDKIIISNSTLSDGVVAFKTDPEPKQLYPDGHPKLDEPKREVASESKKKQTDKAPVDDVKSTEPDGDGSIGHFDF